MFAFLACALAWQAPILQPSRLRTILPNGAVVMVESRPQSRQLQLQLFVSAWNTPESPSTHGYRHLLEHLVAKGTHLDLDRRLESHGAFLSAETLREATNFYISLRPQDLKLGLSAIAELLQLREIPTDEIVREAEVIRQEQALEPVSAQLSQAAWSAAFGTDGLDPEGDPKVMARATSADLFALHRKAFVGPNLALVITGPVDLDEGTSAAAAVLGHAAGGASPKPAMRGTHPQLDEALASDGEARAALVPEFESPSTAARLAAALAIASEIGDAFVFYTPSERGGLIVLGTEERGSDLGKAIDSAKTAALFERGRVLARRWVTRQLDGEGADGFLRGLLLVQGPGLRPDAFLKNVDVMTHEEFEDALAAFRLPRAVGVTSG